MGKQSFFSLAAEEADHFVGEVARLLDRVEDERWTGEFTK
jgi:hypothetical protein